MAVEQALGQMSRTSRILRAVPPCPPRLTVSFAKTQNEIEAAQRLRWRIFAAEMGARLPGVAGIDQDEYDPFCKHLIVRDNGTGEVVGTYRILPPDQAKLIGQYYSENEFDLTRFQHVRDRLVEVGRSCVDAGYRQGGVIALLWSGLARYMQENRHEYLIGCASIPIMDGGHAAADIYRRIQATHPCPPEYRAFPRISLPPNLAKDVASSPIPPLIKGYLRLGAHVCSEPAWDQEFNTADLLTFLPLARMAPRYAKKLLSA